MNKAGGNLIRRCSGRYLSLPMQHLTTTNLKSDNSAISSLILPSLKFFCQIIFSRFAFAAEDYDQLDGFGLFGHCPTSICVYILYKLFRIVLCCTI